MASIIPSSTITLYSHVPFKMGDDNVMLFDNIVQQAQFFNGRYGDFHITRKVVNNCKYIKRTGAIKVPYPIAEVRNCNYLSFMNPEFENKTFYAFITGKDYTSNAATIITYQIDLFQTFMFDFAFKNCFVERETVADDTFGKHTIPEDVTSNVYIYNKIDISDTVFKNANRCVLITTTNGWDEYDPPNYGTDTNVTGGTTIGGIYQGAVTYDFTVEQARKFLQGSLNSGKSSGVMSVTMGYRVRAGVLNGGNEYTLSLTNLVNGSNGKTPTNRFTFGGYTPRNNKLYTYPYNKLYITCNNGGGMDYRLEYFDESFSGTIEFHEAITTNGVQEACVYPLGYMGVIENVGQRIEVGSLPQCTWSYDSFQAQIAQSIAKVNVYRQGVGSIAGAVNKATEAGIGGQAVKNIAAVAKDTAKTSETRGGFIADVKNWWNEARAGEHGQLLETITGGVSRGFEAASTATKQLTSGVGEQVQKTVAGISGDLSAFLLDDRLNINAGDILSSIDVDALPLEVQGTPQPSLLWATNHHAPEVYHTYLKAEYAKMIDIYLSAYGYKINDYKVPSLKNRKYFTYIKTSSAILEQTGDGVMFDGEYLIALESMFNQGLRVWNGSEQDGTIWTLSNKFENVDIDNPTL